MENDGEGQSITMAARERETGQEKKILIPCEHVKIPAGQMLLLFM